MEADETPAPKGNGNEPGEWSLCVWIPLKILFSRIQQSRVTSYNIFHKKNLEEKRLRGMG